MTDSKHIDYQTIRDILENDDKVCIIRSMPKKGSFSISEVAGKTLYPPSEIDKNIKIFVKNGILIDVSKNIEAQIIDVNSRKKQHIEENTRKVSLVGGKGDNHKRHAKTLFRLGRRNVTIKQTSPSIHILDKEYILSEKGVSVKRIIDQSDTSCV